MFHNDNLLTLPAENYAYCKIWDRDRDNYCVIIAMVQWLCRRNKEVLILS